MNRSARRQASHSVGDVKALNLRELSMSCEAALQPIAGQFLDLGFGASQFVQVAKRSYVKAAANAIKKSGQRATVSRIAALTGLQRKEIRSLMEDHLDDAAAIARFPPTMRVLAGWQSDDAFTTRAGRARVLNVEGENSFRELVEKYAGDVTHVAVLRELERLAWVKRTADGLVEIQIDLCELRQRAALVGNFTGRIADYAAALNSASGATEAGYYAGYRESRPTEARLGAALSRTFSRRAEEFLDGFERWVSRSHKQAPTPEPGTASQFGIGIYLVERVPQPTAGGAEPPPKKPRLRSRAKRA